MQVVNRLYRLGLTAPTRPHWAQATDAREGKSQAIRVLDVLLLGPLMIYAGTALTIGPVARWLLVIAGGGTIAFNAANYIRYARESR